MWLPTRDCLPTGGFCPEESLSGGYLDRGGFCPGGVCPGVPGWRPPAPLQPLRHSVGILLECILVHAISTYQSICYCLNTNKFSNIISTETSEK